MLEVKSLVDEWHNYDLVVNDPIYKDGQLTSLEELRKRSLALDRRRLKAARAIGPVIQGYCMPKPDTHFQENYLMAQDKRMFRRLPVPHRLNPHFRAFVRNNMHWLWNPLPLDTDYSFDYFINYSYDKPVCRKDEVRRGVARMQLMEDIPKELIMNKNLAGVKRYEMFRYLCRYKEHLKSGENKPEFHAPRSIRAPLDGAIGYFGPVVHKIEHQVFQNGVGAKFFIKNIDVMDRPRVISERLAGAYHYYATDFTNFESSISSELMRIIEHQVYQYIVSCSPEASLKMKLMEMCHSGWKKCSSRETQTYYKGKRSSGESTTSLGNSLSNFFVCMYVCFLKGVHPRDFKGIFEGDDGLIGLPQDISLTADDFSAFGMKVKIEEYTKVNEAHFCSLIYDPENLTNLVDPIQTLVKFGWSRSKKRLTQNKLALSALVRFAALSLLYQSPQCPVVSALGSRLVFLTEGIEADESEAEWWHKSFLKSADFKKLRPDIQYKVSQGVPMCNRLLVENVFHVPLRVQYELEDIINHLTSIDSIIHYDISQFISHDNVDNWNHYVIECYHPPSRCEL